jgi:hypothetical protein
VVLVLVVATPAVAADPHGFAAGRKDELLADLQFGRNHRRVRRLQGRRRNAIFLGDFGERIALDDDVFRAGHFPAFTGGSTGGSTTGAFVVAGGSMAGELETSFIGGFVASSGAALVIASVGDFFRRLLALAALDEHGGQAGDAHGEHAENGELQAGAALALLVRAASLWGQTGSDYS